MHYATHKINNNTSLVVYYCIVEKIHGIKFRDFALEQTFRGINFAICMLVLCICIVILKLNRGINFHKSSQVVKNMKYKPHKNFLLSSITYFDTCIMQHTPSPTSLVVCIRIIIISFKYNYLQYNNNDNNSLDAEVRHAPICVK